MRIEKINEKQFRCTLNQKDLQDREIGISELAYGTAKAKALFRDMMQQASYEFGFQAQDIPLMIEAIPMLPEALVLIVTKVEEPDELDARFSKFTEETNWYDDDNENLIYQNIDVYEDDDDDEISLYEPENELESESESESSVTWHFSDGDSQTAYKDNAEDKQATPASPGDDFISLPEMLGMEPKPKYTEPKKQYDVVSVFAFQNLDTVTQLAYHIQNIYHGINTLYKDTSTKLYYLVLHRSEHTSEEFAKICNIIYEYGSVVKNSSYSQYYFEEHFMPVIAEHAIQTLADI